MSLSSQQADRAYRTHTKFISDFMNTWIDPDDFFLEVETKINQSGDLQHSCPSCIASLQEKSNNTGITYFPLCIHVLLIIDTCTLPLTHSGTLLQSPAMHVCKTSQISTERSSKVNFKFLDSCRTSKS